jgi:hypothetical protein
MCTGMFLKSCERSHPEIYFRFFDFAFDFLTCLTVRRFVVLRDRDTRFFEDCLFAIKINRENEINYKIFSTCIHYMLCARECERKK